MLMCRRILLSLVFFTCYVHTVAQIQTDTSHTGKGNAFRRFNGKVIRWIIKDPKPFCDTNYVKTFSKVFTTGVPISSKSLRIHFGDKASGNALQYYPSTVYSPGIFINTSLFGFSIAQFLRYPSQQCEDRAL